MSWANAAYNYAERLDERIGKLTAAHIVHLRVEHGLSIRRIAKRVGIREKEVKDILAYCEEAGRD